MIDTRFIWEMCANNYDWVIVVIIQIGVAWILGKK